MFVIVWFMSSSGWLLNHLRKYSVLTSTFAVLIIRDRFPGETVPTLIETIETCVGLDIHMMVEIKKGDNAKEVLTINPRISSNNSPGCLFLFLWSSRVLNRGRALIWGGGGGGGTMVRKFSRWWRTVPKHHLIQRFLFYCTLCNSNVLPEVRFRTVVIVLRGRF